MPSTKLRRARSVGGHAVVGGRNRLGDEALDAAQAGRDAEDPEPVHHRCGLEGVAVVDEAEHPPEAAHLPAGVGAPPHPPPRNGSPAFPVFLLPAPGPMQQVFLCTVWEVGSPMYIRDC
jgi:hypothetical protein